MAGAFWLSTRRDLGSGLVPQRPGPRRASGSVTTPIGLAVRLQRGPIIGWSIGLFITGIVYGSIGQDVEQMVTDNPTYADFFAQKTGSSITDSYFATSMVMLGLLAAGFGISSALRLRAEEAAGRAEPVLATRTSRWSWATSHLVVAVVGSGFVVLSAGLGIGLSFAAVSGDAHQVVRMLGAALVTLPAVLVMVGVAGALFGLVPRLALLAWIAVAIAVVVDVFGALLGLPRWTRQLSPFHQVPGLPAEQLRLLPLVALAGLAAVLLTSGLFGFRERDLRTE